MFDFTITPVWIASQALNLISLVLLVIAFQVKNKNRTLILMASACAFGVVSSVLLGNMAFAVVMTVSVIRSLSFAWMEARRVALNRLFSISVLLVFMAVSVLLVVFAVQWWFDWVLLGSSLFSTYGSWKKGIHLIRISTVLGSVLAIVSHIHFHNFTALLIEAFVIGSIAVFYIRQARAHAE